MSHANARLNEYGRNLIARRVLAGHKPGEVAKQVGVSRQTVHKWVRRFQTEGEAGLTTGPRVRITARTGPAQRSPPKSSGRG